MKVQRRHVLIVAIAAVALTGCSSSSAPPGSDQDSANSSGATSSATNSPAPSDAEPTAPASQPSEDTSPSGVIVNVTVRGDKVEPFGRRVRAHRGQQIVFVVDADRRGALHIHSSPEQTAAFPKGKSNISVQIDKAGVVEVEEHEADTLIAQLEVR